MKKILCFSLISLVCMFGADAAVRGEKSTSRSKNTSTTVVNSASRATSTRSAIKTTVSARAAQPVSILKPRSATTKTKSVATRTPAKKNATKSVSARAATTSSNKTETRTGAQYEQCKTAFFTCMDQFCQMKNDNYRRCSCSDRIYDFQDITKTYQEASERLTEFAENLDVVGMTKEQATAMKTASEGEDALTEDKSASKQLLQAIMNSIKGESSSVGGKYKDLNSINIASDMSNAFGMDDSGQIIASYNGATLYKAVYPKCRNAVQEDCNTASLQRAVNAYLMAVEQDCNTIETALKNQQKTLKASTHQNSAMLDLARVENHQTHNSDDVATCLSNVESAIQSEEVCGSGYHKCLDNGQFIDVTTGAPLTGVKNFYELSNLLTFRNDKDLKDQKLSSLQNNRDFVQFFEQKTKKFASDALDKCSDDADYVWQQYLDRALLDIYYAQVAKVKTIQDSCISLIAKCYDNQDTAIANAMANLTGDSTILLKPAAVTLTTEMCSDYITSCNNMFSGNIIETYMKTKNDTDTKSACRAIAQQCFDDFGGTGYNNFYYTQSGLFALGEAMDWFTLYDYNGNLVSNCAKQLSQTTGCKEPEMLEEVFGGFDKNESGYIYSVSNTEDRIPRTSGIATEVYYKTIDNLRTQCESANGYFVEYKYLTQYGYKPSDFCKINSNDARSVFYRNSTYNTKHKLAYWYNFLSEEDMCPQSYSVEVDTQSWGICSCWEHGGYRSRNGRLKVCRPILPIYTSDDSSREMPMCSEDILSQSEQLVDAKNWCQQSVVSSLGQVCPAMYIKCKGDGTDGENNECDKAMLCADKDGNEIDAVSNNVPHHKVEE